MSAARILKSRPLRNRRHGGANQRPIPTAADIFRARAEARAALFVAGELDLHQAVDALQAAAISSSLLGEIGQDAVQAILATAFGKARRDV